LKPRKAEKILTGCREYKENKENKENKEYKENKENKECKECKEWVNLLYKRQKLMCYNKSIMMYE